ncbi:MAG: TonB-dependent receptor [Chitinophagaceae bacterium]|nr:MAG: TonB-dependent receptor [Chitinophagaceae bacterium]
MLALFLFSLSDASGQDSTLPKRDTIPSKSDSIPAKADSVVPKRDTLPLTRDSNPARPPVSNTSADTSKPKVSAAVVDSTGAQEFATAKTDTIPAVGDTTGSVSGVITSFRGEPLPGATITIKGTPRNVKSDSTGRFSIDAAVGIELEITYVGYAPQTVAVTGKPLTIILGATATENKEVVVVGYGTQRRIANTGSIASVRGAEITQTPVVNVAQGLQGRVAGVQVTQNNAAPGGNISVRVRGTNSINGSSEPLYIIDGIQVSNEAGGNSVSPLSTLNPGDIESVEILKDAAATAIYGSRAANGVVLITTKRGRQGETAVQVDLYSGFQELPNKIPVLNATEFAALENEVYNTAVYPDPVAQGKGTDWQDLIFRRGWMQNAQVSASGGNEKTQFSVSGNYFNQEGIIIKSNYRRYSLRAALDNTINDKFKFGATILGSYGINRSVPTASSSIDAAAATSSIVGAALGAPPTLTPFREDGSIFPLGEQYSGRYREVANPLGLAEIYSQQAVKRTLANVYIEAKPIRDLVYRASFNADLSSSLADMYSPIYIIAPADRNENSGSASKSNGNVTSLLHESILTYTKAFGDHDFKVTGVYGSQSIASNSNTINANGFPNDLTRNEALQLAVNRTVTTARTREVLHSFMGRINYGYADKYFLDFTARYDGNSKFGANNKWGFFPAVSGAWRIIEEPFLQESKFFSDLKLRASYGLTGNAAAIGPYQSLATVASGNNYAFDHLYVTGINPSGIPNPDLRWEKSTQMNFGLDLSVLDNRIGLVVDVYRKTTEDLLFLRQLPISSGYGTIIGNFASIRNQGVEFAVNAKILDGDFKWNANANVSVNRNKLLSLAGGLDEFVLSQYGVLRVGQPLGVFKTYSYGGLYQNGEAILPGSDGRLGGPKVVDLDKDGTITGNDQSITGRANPDLIFGFSTNMNYKNFDLSVFVSGVIGNEIFNLSRYSFENALGGRNVLEGLINRWNPDNPTNDYANGLQGGRLPITDRFIEDGSFVRIKNLSLGYTFKNLIGTRSARIYVSANNLYTFTNYSGYDPEVNTFGGSNTSVGIDNLVYPQAKSFLAGIQVAL